MMYWHLVYQIPAAVTLAMGLAYLMPVALDKRLNPLLMFIAAMLCLVLPQVLVLALAMCVPMGLLNNYLGIRLQGHEPFQVPWHRMTDSLKTLPGRLRPEPVKEFLTRAYEEPDLEPGVTLSNVPKYVPEL